eukprot:1141418-Pelagomonas_calceolata.AAC.1
MKPSESQAHLCLSFCLAAGVEVFVATGGSLALKLLVAPHKLRLYFSIFLEILAVFNNSENPYSPHPLELAELYLLVCHGKYVT